jgi:rubrerythrin
MNEVNLIQASIEQLERVSRSIASIGEIEDYTEVAINALEKQILKKPRKTDSYRGVLKRVYAYVCPTCGNVCLEKYMNKRQNTMFCWNCGQKIDWSDEE